jgi:hypothetical protein
MFMYLQFLCSTAFFFESLLYLFFAIRVQKRKSKCAGRDRFHKKNLRQAHPWFTTLSPRKPKLRYNFMIAGSTESGDLIYSGNSLVMIHASGVERKSSLKTGKKEIRVSLLPSSIIVLHPEIG